jgi:cysteine desulfurase/selenocysteine lyase
MRWLGIEATARASFAAHSDSSDIETLVRGIEQVKRIFG